MLRHWIWYPDTEQMMLQGRCFGNQSLWTFRNNSIWSCDLRRHFQSVSTVISIILTRAEQLPEKITELKVAYPLRLIPKNFPWIGDVNQGAVPQCYWTFVYPTDDPLTRWTWKGLQRIPVFGNFENDRIIKTTRTARTTRTSKALEPLELSELFKLRTFFRVHSVIFCGEYLS